MEILKKEMKISLEIKREFVFFLYELNSKLNLQVKWKFVIYYVK